jgi:hypothetical protein
MLTPRALAGELGPGESRAEAVAALFRGLRAELELLDALRSQLVNQRAALAADDAASLESVVNQIGRTLLTLGEARRQRPVLIELIAPPGTGLREMADSLDPAEASTFERLRSDLHGSAVAASRELQVNQAAIRRAIESGERYLHHLLTAPGTQASEPQPEVGLLLNQRA